MRDQIRRDHLVRLENAKQFFGGEFRKVCVRRQECRRYVGEGAFGELAGPTVRGGEMCEEVSACEVWWSGESAAFHGDAPDAAVGFVAVGMAEASLVMADDRIVPITDVERAFGTELCVYRAEGAIGGGDEWFEIFEREAGTIFQDAERPDGVIDVAAQDQLALPVVGKVRGAHNIATADLSAFAVFPNERRSFVLAA